MALDDPFTYCENDLGSLVLVERVEPIEHSKDAISLGGIDADPLVADGRFRIRVDRSISDTPRVAIVRIIERYSMADLTSFMSSRPTESESTIHTRAPTPTTRNSVSHP